jgi:hypothetical protein
MGIASPVATTQAAQTGAIETSIPARLDRLPWSRFHWLVVAGLGTVWILDGLEVMIVGSVASRMTEKGSGIQITSAGIGARFWGPGRFAEALREAVSRGGIRRLSRTTYSPAAPARN